MQRKPLKGAQCRRTNETAACQLRSDLMYRTIGFEVSAKAVVLILCERTDGNKFSDNMHFFNYKKRIYRYLIR